MTFGAILVAVLKFLVWEAAIFGVSVRLARLVEWETGTEEWLAILAIEVTLESSFAAALSFASLNSAVAYWVIAAVCMACARMPKLPKTSSPWIPAIAALTAPLVLLSFRPVDEFDSINYLHYLIDWMANRATPYVFATNYVAFWELSFLPVWSVTRVDLFFPLLALKAVVVLALALWLMGRELRIPTGLLSLAIFGSLMMRHYWLESSGVPTLKNDALHGAGFVLLTLVIVRAGRLRRGDILLLALGTAFASVKYTGIFFAAIAAAIVLWRDARFRLPVLLCVPPFLLLTSGHYYLHNFIRYGSPFYPFQINLAWIHLPGTADLSYSSILYNLHDSRLWRALFLPAGGLSPAGLFFPAILAAVLPVSAWRCLRAVAARKAGPLDWTAFSLLCGWMLYSRSVYGACAAPGDLAFILNGLNSVRYVDGVLAVSELFLVTFLMRFPWLAGGVVGINAASRLFMLYSKESFSPLVIIAVAVAVPALLIGARRRSLTMAALMVMVATPFVVEWNRARWTPEWNELKPYLQKFRGPDLAELALPEAEYFAGHAVAAGNPVDPSVRSLLPEEVESARPRYLAIMITPGSENTWRAHYGAQLSAWGYQTVMQFRCGALLERQENPLR
jgi:hypothetical protein